MSSIWITVVGLVNGVVKLFNGLLDYFKELKWVNIGKSLNQAEIAKEEAQITRETSEIINEDRTKEDTANRMDDGTF